MGDGGVTATWGDGGVTATWGDGVVQSNSPSSNALAHCHALFTKLSSVVTMVGSRAYQFLMTF